MANMTIEYVTKAKIESLSTIMPQVLTRALLAPKGAQFILLTDEKLLSSYFVAAIVLEKEIIWISDSDYTEIVKKYLDETN